MFKGVHRSHWNWFWKTLPSKQKLEYGYLNFSVFMPIDVQTIMSWLKFDIRWTALNPDKSFKPGSAKNVLWAKSGSPPVSVHLRAKSTFYIFKWLKKIRIFYNTQKLHEIQITMSINKVLLEHSNLDQKHKSIVHIQPDYNNLKGLKRSPYRKILELSLNWQYQN